MSTYYLPMHLTSELSLQWIIHINPMSPRELCDGGEPLAVNVCATDTRLGRMLIASTPKGVCFLAFDDEDARFQLQQMFGHAVTTHRVDAVMQPAIDAIEQPQGSGIIRLHLKGTDFQFRVWQALLTVPWGTLTTYGQLAQQLGCPKASRAVGSAVGKNPVAVLIPCHRIIPATGGMGNYRWGKHRKAMLIEQERQLINPAD